VFWPRAGFAPERDSVASSLSAEFGPNSVFLCAAAGISLFELSGVPVSPEAPATQQPRRVAGFWFRRRSMLCCRGNFRFRTRCSRTRFSDQVTGPIQSPVVPCVRPEHQYSATAVVRADGRHGGALSGSFQRIRPRAIDPLPTSVFADY